MTITLRMLVMGFAAVSSMCALSPLWTFVLEVLSLGSPVAYHFSVLEAVNGRARVYVSITYLGSVPLHRYNLTVDPKCPGCIPDQVKGDVLSRGDTVSLIIELASQIEDVRVELEGYVAGLYRFKASVRTGARLGG